jgi:hypothetical protein
VNAMTESGVRSSRQDTTPGRPLASTARPPRGCASGQSPWRAALGGCLDHLSLLRSANRRPLGRLDPSSGAARTPVAPPARAARGRRGARARSWRSNSPTAPGISAPPPRSRSRSAPFRDAWSFLPAVPGISSLTGLGNEISF